MSKCLFCKISNLLDKSDTMFQFEDDQIVAFNDINPQAPVHILIVPKCHISTIVDITETDVGLVGKMIKIASELAMSNGLKENGYRLVFNVKNHGGQVVDHIHLHLLGGKHLGKMNS